MAERGTDGRWQKGHCPNPGGRPKALVDVQALAREHTETAIKTLIEVCKNSKHPAASRVSAATALLDRAWGRPNQSTDVNVNAQSDSLFGVLASLAVKREMEENNELIQ